MFDPVFRVLTNWAGVFFAGIDHSFHASLLHGWYITCKWVRTDNHIELGDHTLSIPGFVRVENPNGRWAELRLVRLEWNEGEEMPPLPGLPLCTGQPER